MIPKTLDLDTFKRFYIRCGLKVDNPFFLPEALEIWLKTCPMRPFFVKGSDTKGENLVVRDLFRENRVRKMNLRTEYPYMGLWTPHREEFRSIVIFNGRPKSRMIYHLMKMLRPLLGEIRRRTELRVLSHRMLSV